MPTYITLFRWTQEGIEKIKESPARLAGARELFKKFGGELKAFYLVMGPYDAIIVGEAPNDEAMARISLAAGAKGAVRSETLRAFTEAEYESIISALP